MTSRKRVILALATVVTRLVFVNPVAAESLKGGWKNIDPASTNISRLRIAESAAEIRIHVWGACHPTDCDWGSVTVRSYGSNTKEISGEVWMAEYFTRESRALLILRPESGGRLRVETYTRFTGKSTDPLMRTDSYVMVDHFKRKSE